MTRSSRQDGLLDVGVFQGEDSGMNIKRLAALSGLVLIVCLGFAALIVGYVLYSDLLDGQIADLLQAQLGRPVEISGPTSLQVFPVPGVSLENVHIGGSENDGPKVRVRRVRVVLEPGPLLFGDIVLRGCELVGPEVTLQRRSLPTHTGDKKRGLSGMGPAGVDFRKVRVIDGSMVWIGKSGTAVRIREVSILPEGDDGKRAVLEGQLLVVSGEEGPVLFEGRVRMSALLQMGAQAAFEDIRFFVDGSGGIRSRPFQVQGGGRVDLSEMVLALPKVSVRGKENELLSGVRVQKQEQGWELSLDDLRLNGRQLLGEVVLTGEEGEPHVAVRCGTVDFSLWQDLFQQGGDAAPGVPLFQGLLYELTHAGGRLDVAVDSLPWSGFSLGDVRLSGSLSAGEVRLLGSARMPGGAVKIGLQGLACPEQMTGTCDFELMDATGRSVLAVGPSFVLMPDKLGVRLEVPPVSLSAVRAVTGISGSKTEWLKQIGGHGTLEADVSGVRFIISELRADDLAVAGSVTVPAGKAACSVDLDFQGHNPGSFLSAFKETDGGSEAEARSPNRSLLPGELGVVTVRNLVLDDLRVNKAILNSREGGRAVRFSADGSAYGRPVRVSGNATADPGGIRVSVAGQGEILSGRTLEAEVSGFFQETRQRFLAEKLSWSLLHAGADKGTLQGTLSGVIDMAQKQADLKSFSATGDVLDCSGSLSLGWAKTPGLSGSLAIRSLKLVSLLQDWGLKLWPMADSEILNHLAGTTAVSLNRERVLFDISQVDLDKGSTVAGKVLIRLDRPEINLDLDAGYLKLDRLLPGGRNRKSRLKNAEQKHRLRLDGTIRARIVDWRKLRFSNVSTRLTLGGGILRFSPLTATLHKGRLEGTITSDFRPEPSRLDISCKGQGVEAGPLMIRLVGSPKMTGIMGFSLDISGTPAGSGGYLAGLVGTTQLNVRKGGIVFEKGHAQSFKVLAGSGSIRRGRLTCRDFSATFGRSTATGEGIIDLGGQAVNGTFVVETPSVSPLASVPLLNQVKTLTDLSSLGWPSLRFHITGDLLKPKVSLDREQLALDVGREVITSPVTVGERVLGAGKNMLELGGRAAGKVAETIGGLFGGRKGGQKEAQNNTVREEP